MKSKLFKCTKGFTLPMFDDDGHRVEGRVIAIVKGGLWKQMNGSVLGAPVHLEQVGMPWNWIDITQEMFDEYFEKEVKLKYGR